MDRNIIYYELNPSQEVVKLQCAYTLFKCVINIVMSASSKDEIDFNLMKQALNKTIERNDCLRIRFCKVKGKLMQYFLPEFKFEEVPYLEFNSEEEQNEFIKKQTKTAIKYMKGEVIKPFFIKTFDGKYMIFLKVCHLIFDIYGLNVFFKDLFEVYNALKNGIALPEAPKPFEAIVKNDIKTKHDPEKSKRDYDYFADIFRSHEEPYYAGFDGLTNKYTLANKQKGKRAMRMFFIKNDTKGYMHQVNNETVEKVMKFAQETKISMSNIMLYAFSITQSRMNNNVKSLLPIELCNCRATLAEKKCAGTKAQSISCYVTVDENNTFNEAIANFNTEQILNYKHVGFKDLDSQFLIHKTYKSSMFSTYYSLAFSFIYFNKPEGIDFQIYSNGKCALPAYVAVLYNPADNTFNIAYDCQIKLMTEKNVEDFHNNLVKVLNQVLNNPEIKIKDIKL